MKTTTCLLVVLCFLGFVACTSQNQLLLRVQSAAPYHTAQDTLYVAGNFNRWNPGSAEYRLQYKGKGRYQIYLPVPATNIEFKFTRGSWETVEADAAGNDINNRSVTADTRQANLRIAGWKAAQAQPSSTALPTVHVLYQDLYMPQLKRTRRIWICLPDNYAKSGQHYPVIYMHDGQNLFDNKLAFSGEWGVDETLKALGEGAIVVGIDNGGEHRTNEYAPYKNANYGGGEGEAYLNFLTQTLKPKVDSAFRTLPDAPNTVIAGSSMGGLISMYAIAARPDVFGNALVFSPSFWFNEQIFDFVQQRAADVTENHRIYFFCGDDESAEMVPDMQKMYDLLLRSGLNRTQMAFRVEYGGKHSESYWRKAFLPALQWLMQ